MADLRRLRQLYERAAALDARARRAFLDRECGAEDRGQVESLLRYAELPSDGLATGVTSAQERLGPYRLDAILGRGGCGVVYRASHVDSGRPAAVKTVLDPDALVVSSMRREIHVLAQMRHPCVVRVLDDGVAGGIPWYAMELIEGVDLRTHVFGNDSVSATRVGSWWTQAPTMLLDRAADAQPGSTPAPTPAPRATTDEALRVMVLLCRALAHLHGEGIVHRDLKPENVLVRPDGLPVIVDFGLMERFGGGASSRERLQETIVGGTLSYLAPEQWEGGLVDARADLYSVGCMLYEILTGRPPFVGDTAGEVLRKHANEAPVAPSLRTAGVDPVLDRLALGLLAKNPRERIGHADVVVDVLERLGHVARLPEPAPASRAYLYRAALAGRRPMLARLVDHLERLDDGGRIVIVTGESGIGKTRLLMELSLLARRAGALVLAGEALPPQPGRTVEASTLAAFRRPFQSLVDLCRPRGEEERLLGERGPILAPFCADIRSLPGQAARPQPQTIPADAATHRLLRAVSETLRAAASERRVLLMVDDAQWADPVSNKTIELLARSPWLAGSPLLIVLACRAEEPTPTIDRLRVHPFVDHVSLGRLDDNAVASIVGDMLALEPVPARFALALAQHAEGNPFFVAEYLRAAVTDGLLARSERGGWAVGNRPLESWERIPLPSTVQELLERRLASLGLHARRMVEAAAVAGREIESDVLLRTVATEDDLADLAEIVRKQVMEEHGERLRFVHDKLREAAYAAMTAEERCAWHGRLAATLDAMAIDDPARIGFHWRDAGDRQRARPHLAAAARRAIDSYDFSEAASSYEAYLSLVDEPTTESISARLGYATHVLSGRGYLVEARGEIEQAQADALQLQSPRLVLQSRRALGAVARKMGQQVRARAHFEAATAMVEEADDPGEERSLLNELGDLARSEARMEEAEKAYLAALDISTRLGEREEDGTSIGNLGLLYMEQGRWDEADDLLQRALAIHRRKGNARNLALVHSTLGILDGHRGDVRGARQHHQRSLELARRSGDRWTESAACGNLGSVEAEEGQWGRAREHFESALEIAREVQDPRLAGAWLSGCAEAAFMDGRLNEACAMYAESLDLATQSEDERELGRILACLAVVHGCAGQPDLAERHGQEARERLARFGKNFYLNEALCALGHLAHQRGESGRPWLAESEQLAADLGVGTDSPVAKQTAALRRAVEAFESGAPLLCGHVAEDLPPKLRAALMGPSPDEV